jgi:hypothetical protein
VEKKTGGIFAKTPLVFRVFSGKIKTGPNFDDFRVF